MTEHYDCPSCAQPITDDRWIQVDVRGGAGTGVSFISRDRYHQDCWQVMTEEAYTAAVAILGEPGPC